jgi:Holliday junction resolvase RusA-like endonuclease
MSRLVPYFVGEDDAAVTILGPDHRHVQEINFEISGDPRPLQRPRWARRWFKRIITYNPSWRMQKQFKNAAREVMFLRPSDNPVFNERTYLEVNCCFVIKRPMNHFTNAGNLRADAGRFPENSDVDNLAKFVLDALQGILYPDDRRIVVLFAIKTYPSQNDPRTNFGRTIIWAKVK